MKLVTLSSLFFIPLALCAAVPRQVNVEADNQESTLSIQEQQDLINTFLVRQGMAQVFENTRLLTNQIIQEETERLQMEDGPTNFSELIDKIFSEKALKEAESSHDVVESESSADVEDTESSGVDDIDFKIDRIIDDEDTPNITTDSTGTPGEVISNFLRELIGPKTFSSSAFGDIFSPQKPSNSTRSPNTSGSIFDNFSGAKPSVNSTSGKVGDFTSGTSGFNSSSGGPLVGLSSRLNEITDESSNSDSSLTEPLDGIVVGSKNNNTHNANFLSLGDLANGITGGLNNIANGLTGVLTGSKGNNTNTVGNILGGITGGLNNAINGPKGNNTNPVDNLLGGITGGLNNALNGSKGNNTNPLSDLLGGITGGLNNAINGSKGNNTNPVDNLLGGITGSLNNALNGSKGNNTNPLSDLLGGITGGLNNTINGSKGNNTNPLGDLLDGITGGLSGVLPGSKGNNTNPLGDLLNGITNGLTGKGNGTNPFSDLLGGLAGGLIGQGNSTNPLGSLLGGLTGGFANITGSIGGGLVGGLTNITNPAGGLENLLGGLANAAGGLLDGITGGIVNPNFLNGGLTVLGEVFGGLFNGSLDIPAAIGQIIDFVAKVTGAENPLGKFIAGVANFLSYHQDGIIANFIKYSTLIFAVTRTVTNIIRNSIANIGGSLIKGFLHLVFGFFGKLFSGGLFHRLQTINANDITIYQNVFLDAVRSKSPEAAIHAKVMFDAAHLMIQRTLISNPNILNFLVEPTPENISAVVDAVAQFLTESY